MNIKELKEFIVDLPDETEVKALFFNGAMLPAFVEFRPKFKPNEKDYILVTTKN